MTKAREEVPVINLGNCNYSPVWCQKTQNTSVNQLASGLIDSEVNHRVGCPSLSITIWISMSCYVFPIECYYAKCYEGLWGLSHTLYCELYAVIVNFASVMPCCPIAAIGNNLARRTYLTV